MGRTGPNTKNNDIPLPRYITMKLSMLQSHFKIKLTDSEIERMKALPTEMAVDNYAHTLIMQKL